MPKDYYQLTRDAALRVADAVDALNFSEPTTHIYNPLRYAWASHDLYLRRYATGAKKVVFLGMNPGPYGMAQTGVPFGEVEHVRDWIGVKVGIEKPAIEHPKRPIDGFECTRSEVSGRRLWGCFKERFGEASAFFADHFVTNYCPLVFMEDGGKNRTPDKLSTAEVEPLYDACDQHLRDIAGALEPDWLIGVGAFAESRARIALADFNIQIGRILHPSPASPAANRGWASQAVQQMQTLGIWS